MNKLLRAVLPIALVAAGAMPSYAADYDPPIVIDAVDDYVPVEVGNGWYLRGDLGYSISTSASGADAVVERAVLAGRENVRADVDRVRVRVDDGHCSDA